jgi:molecular chaperone GrpE
LYVSRESRTHFQHDPEDEVSVELGGRADSAPDPAPAGGNGGGQGACVPPEEIETLRKAVAQAEDNARAQRDLYLRAAAELDNVRKRAQRDIDQAHRYAVEAFAAELLPVRDSLELAVRNAANADTETLLAGERATLKLLEHAFEKFSIKPLDPQGQPFDPNQHEAVLMQETDRAPPNSVLQVVQSGYELNGRLLRPARVIVAKAAQGTAAE